MLESVGLAIIGIVLLPLASHSLVNGAVALSERLGVSALVVAVTVVAFGTSLPELVVSLRAAMAGSSAIAVGNVVGSNIANILLILGITALIKPIISDPKENRRDSLIMVAVTFLLVLMALSGEIPRWQGFVMVVLLLAFVFQSYRRGSHNTEDSEDLLTEVKDFEGLKNHSWAVIVGALILGLVGVVAGAHLLVTGAVDIARTLGVSEEVIGLTMVAVGTSLPELAVSAAAALKGRPEVAIGNVLGSNIFNILAILGITALVIPIQIPQQIIDFDLWAVALTAILVVPVLWRRRGMGWMLGLFFLTLYAVYIAIQYVGVSHLLGQD